MCINRTMIMILIQASISFLCDNDFAMFVAATASDVRVIPFEQLYLLWKGHVLCSLQQAII